MPGLSPAHLSPRQYAIMSPWMLAKRATAEAFAAIDDLVDAYLDHWLGLVHGGIPEAALEGADAEALIERGSPQQGHHLQSGGR